MKTFFDYCYYRISMFYEAWGEKNGHYAGSAIVWLALGSIVLSLAVVVLHLIKQELDNKIIAITFAPFVVASAIYISKYRYNNLKERYKHEKHRKLKGWCVCVYIVVSIALFFVTVNVFDV